VKKDSTVLIFSILAAIALVVVMGLGLSVIPNVIESMNPTPSPTPGGLVLDPPRPVADFTLTDPDGKPFSISSLHGKAVILFFGYTHCPDVCPLTLGDFKAIKKNLQEKSPQLAERTAFVFISVDGKRDTPDVMKPYVTAFDPAFIGLTGDPDKVASIGLVFGAKAEIEAPTDNADAYTVAHTSFTYLLDPQGRWAEAFPFQTPKDVIAGEIERVLQ
jgi:protein SCO1